MIDYIRPDYRCYWCYWLAVILRFVRPRYGFNFDLPENVCSTRKRRGTQSVQGVYIYQLVPYTLIKVMREKHPLGRISEPNFSKPGLRGAHITNMVEMFP